MNMKTCSKCKGRGTIPDSQEGEVICPKCEGETMIFSTTKIELKLVRSFGLGIRVMSPKLNGFCVAISITCFILHIWSRGEKWFGFGNYWNG